MRFLKAVRERVSKARFVLPLRYDAEGSSPTVLGRNL